MFTKRSPNQLYTRSILSVPQIQLKGMTGRLIVSAIGHPTEKISEFIDLHLRQHVEDLLSCLKDTTDHLNKTPSSGSTEYTLLVTMDDKYLRITITFLGLQYNRLQYIDVIVKVTEEYCRVFNSSGIR